jgi:D-serine deaminase-like pyridoxal phosphate-dependent protein
MMNISQPTLLLHEQTCRANIKRMAEKARKLGLVFRPHFKTHQSYQVGEWFRDVGVTSITVSSVKMAHYFSQHGWNDITIAFPLNAHEHARINEIATSVSLNLCVVNTESLKVLIRKLKSRVGIFIEVDTGYRRTGVDPTDTGLINGIVNLIRQHTNILSFKGFLCHAGHSYKARSQSDVESIHHASMRSIVHLSNQFKAAYPQHVVSVGDTPSCSLMDAFTGAHEIRPGNFAFYDLTQCAIGSCYQEDIAIALACPVVAVYPSREEIVIHGGAVHLSKDNLFEEGRVHFGKVVFFTGDKWELPASPMYVKSLSQEHGIIHAEGEDLNKVQVGDVIGVLPVHSCLMADAMKEYQLFNGSIFEMMH